MIVTGACGHLGSRLIRELWHKLEAPLTLIDNLSTYKQCALYGMPEKVRFIEADVRAVDKDVYRDQTVIHLAAISEPQRSLTDKWVQDHNMELTRHIVESVPAHLIFASTAGVYGPQPGITDEKCTDFNPQTPYSEAKLRDEIVIQSLLSNYTILRFGTLFGYSVGMRFHTAVNKFCWQAVTKQPITVWQGAIDQKRPYLDISDAVDVVKNCRPGIHNVATTNATVRDVISVIERHVHKITVNTVPSPPIDQGSYQLALKPGTAGSLERGIKETLGRIS